MRFSLMRFGIVAIAAGGVVTPAPAFYWIGGPGAGTTVPPSIISNTERVDHRPPPGGTNPPDVFFPPPGGNPEDPKGVPEPGTMALAAAGLGVVAARWVKWRRK